MLRWENKYLRLYLKAIIVIIDMYNLLETSELGAYWAF